MTLPDPAPALVYLRADISGDRCRWDETRLRGLAIRLGYEPRATIVATAAAEGRIELLLRGVELHRAEAVFVPGREHLDGQVERVKARIDIIVDVDDIEARWTPTMRAFHDNDGPPEAWR
ncbi:hypothetical protein [Nocardia brevicatena]|uniref:hypothetical protein n=1 Tax=Nocardia brevicatena TaxID=37327 RepID=UPI00031DC76B|nr:hypothetical protein [Nocardia brevicatena]